MRWIHVFFDNARYHHAYAVQDWMNRPGRRIVLHFMPTYCPHLNPIERLLGVMHKHAHNQYYATFEDFADAILTFLTQTVAKNFSRFSSRITDNFHILDPKDFRVVA